MPPPARQFGALFAHVQESGIFADSKTFADAVPRRPVDAILREWQDARPGTDDALRDFVAANFTLPETGKTAAPQGLPMTVHIDALWDMLTRSGDAHPGGGSEISLPHPYVVPGGRFRELYYWDSYFTMLGLAQSGRQQLVEAMIADFGSLLNRFGHIPNGTRTYYLSRSQPPFFYLMADLSHDMRDAARRQRLVWMQREHAFWMAGADTLAPGEEHRRVVRLDDGSLLNRYWDDHPAPRDESWREDTMLAQTSAQPPECLWRNLRAAAESGWDFSSRWLGGAGDLASIRTTRLVPIDLNCLIYGLESAIAREAAALRLEDVAMAFVRRARARAKAIDKHMWSGALDCHVDFDLDTHRASKMLTAASAFPLFVGLVAPQDAPRIAAALEPLVKPGGLATTLRTSGQQWDAPNGWAPLQWIAIVGLANYGEHARAERIARRWLDMVESHYRTHGDLLEKYDVERRGAGGGGEYLTETGFGWTNGVVLDLLARFGGIEPVKPAAAPGR